MRRTNYRIKALPLNPPIYRTIAIGYLKKDALPAASKRFIELLKSKADTLSDTTHSDRLAQSGIEISKSDFISIAM
jgi:plasmid stabilization system protein ParE